jgi:multidrug efflux pump subunit AcrA (membrane-fusion protein)
LQANVDAAALKVAEIEALLASTSLTAPFDGEIVSLTAVPGFAVSAFAPIGVVADVSQVEANASLRDAQMETLSEGTPVLISLSNRPGDTFPATITRLPYPYGSGGGSGDFAETDLTTRFSFDNPADAELFAPGERVSINVVIEAKDGVLYLPEAAVREFNGRHFVVVKEGDVEQRIDITLGISGNGVVEILDGLSAGQVVVGQ